MRANIWHANLWFLSLNIFHSIGFGLALDFSSQLFITGFLMSIQTVDQKAEMFIIKYRGLNFVATKFTLIIMTTNLYTVLCTVKHSKHF